MTTTESGARQPAVRYCPDCGTPESGLARFCTNCFHLKGAGPDIRAATFLRRLSAYILDFVLFFATLIIGYIIWWLITLKDGQTPGKQLVGIRAVRLDGRPLGWGLTFVREFVVKGLVIGVLSNFFFGIIYLVNYLFPLFDKDLQTIHDKIMSSLVVGHDPSSAARTRIDTGSDPWARQVESR